MNFNRSKFEFMIQPSIWELESFYAPRDIIIVGSGFVGLWTAYYLKKKHPNLSVAIVERGSIPTGASTRNAGFACFGSVTELIADAGKLGDDKMLEIAEMRYKGMRKIRKVFNDDEIGYEHLGGYELIAKSSGNGRNQINELRTHMDDINRKLKTITGKTKTFQLSDDKINDFGFAGVDHLLENRMEGQLHSGKLCSALLSKVQGMGVTVFNNIEISSIEQINGQKVLLSQSELPLVAKQILVCTNAFAKQLFPNLDVEPARGQVLLSSPIEDLRFKGCFHFDEGFYYFRNLGNRIMLGGARNKAIEDEHSSAFEITQTIQNELERYLRETILPGRPSYTIEHRWSGIMALGQEKFPLLKELSPGIFCAVRMSGMGVALAPEIGKKMTEMMLG